MKVCALCGEHKPTRRVDYKIAVAKGFAMHTGITNNACVLACKTCRSDFMMRMPTGTRNSEWIMN